MLTGDEILRQVQLGNIVIDPFDEKQLGANSYDLRLSDQIVVYDERPAKGIGDRPYETWTDPATKKSHRVLDMAKDNPTVALTISPEGMLLVPGRVYLACTQEYTETRGFCPKIEGRSSVGRLGIVTHLTAGFGDNGFCGDWTLEISVVEPVRVYAGVRICQIVYETLVGEQDRKYEGRYQGQCGPKASRLWRDVAEDRRLK
jgi:dCTP deaminase